MSPDHPINAQRWLVVAEVFLQALERAPVDRGPFVAEAVCGDDELRQEVEALLASHDAAGSFMEVAAVQAAAPMPPTIMTDAADPGAGVPARDFGDYEILGEIARGGMGVVYKARQRGLNRLVALKMIAGGAWASPALVRRFRTEAEAAATLSHPNIVPIYEIGEHDGQHYFSMRLLESSLQQRISEYWLCPRDSPDSRADSRAESDGRQSRIARLMVTIARAVHHAHQHGVLHRDLKPANILLDAAGEPLVADFGLAKLLEANRDNTESLAVLGTPNYMSPEQCAGGSRHLSTTADVFSLGAILYQLLTRHPPFEASSPMETIRQVMEREPATVRSLNKDVDPDLEIICLKCLDKDPRRRYSSAGAMADELDRWLSGEPIAARFVTPAERAWRWCRRKPLLATLSIGLAVAVASGGTVSTLQWHRAEVNASTLREHLYAADVSVAFQAWQSGHVERARELLARHRPAGGEVDLRTFEWRLLSRLARPRELRILKTGSDEVWGSAVSPDGRLLVTGGGDGQVQLWELPEGRLSATLRAGSTIVYAVAFSPDGRLIAVANDNPDVTLWDVATHKKVATLGPHPYSVLSVAFSPDGRTLASMAGYPYATDTPAELTLWDVGSQQRVATLAGHTSSSGWLGFSPDGRLLATPHGDGSVTLWDLETKRVVGTLVGHQGLVFCARFSPDGELLASAGVDGTVRLWQVESRRAMGIVGSHEGAVYAVAFSPRGDRLVSTGIDHSVKLWDTQARRVVTTFRGHASRVFSVNFLPDGRTVQTASLDGTARFWDATEPPDDEVFARHTGSFAHVGFSRDGRWLVRADHGATQVTMWDAPTWRQVATLPQAFAAFSADTPLLATSAGEMVTVWDMSGAVPRTRATIQVPRPLVIGPSVSPDGRHVAIAIPAGTEMVSIWDVATQQRRAHLPGHDAKAGVLTHAFSPDGRHFAAGFDDGRVVLWDAGTWATQRDLVGHTKKVHALAFSPDSRLLASASADTTVRVWRSAGAGTPIELRGDSGSVHAVAFSPDGETLVTGSADGLVTFWHIRTAREIGALRAHQSVVSSVGFAPDGLTLVTTSVDQTTRLWRAPR